MNKEIKLKDKVFILNKEKNNFVVKEMIVSGIDINCNNEQTYNLNYINKDICNYTTYTINGIFKTKIEAEKYLQTLLQKSKFKIGDIVIFDKKFKNSKVYQIINYDINFTKNIIKYKLKNLYGDFCYNYDLKDIDIIDENLLKLDIQRFKELFKYKELIKKLDLIYKEDKETQKQVFEFEDEIKNKFDLILNYEHRYYLLDFLNKTPMFKDIFYKEKLKNE